MRAFTTSRIQESARRARAAGVRARKAAPCSSELLAAPTTANRARRRAARPRYRARGTPSTSCSRARSTARGGGKRTSSNSIVTSTDSLASDRTARGVLRKERAFAIMKARGETNRLNANLPPRRRPPLGG